MDRCVLNELNSALKTRVVSLDRIITDQISDSNKSFNVVFDPSNQRYIKVYCKRYLRERGLKEYANVLRGEHDPEDDEWDLGQRVLDNPTGPARDFLESYSELVDKYIIPFIRQSLCKYAWMPQLIAETESYICVEWYDSNDWRPANVRDFLCDGEPTSLFIDVINCYNTLHCEERIDIALASTKLRIALDEIQQYQQVQERWEHQDEWCVCFEYSYITDFLIKTTSSDAVVWKYIDIDNLWVFKPNLRIILEHGPGREDNGKALSRYIHENSIEYNIRYNAFLYYNNQWVVRNVKDLLR